MNKDNETIVVIGDWFIDENWLIAKHNTDTSSHTGDKHYLSKNKAIDNRMISLCGASEILEVLRTYFKDTDIEFIAFGAWNKKDDKILKCTLCREHSVQKYLTPYTLKGLLDLDECEHPAKCPYVTNGQCNYNPLLFNLSASENTSTNRIIRCYEGYGSGYPHLLYRFDWQLPLYDSDLNLDLFDILNGKNVTAVVIEDHNKGVISPKSIQALLEKLGDSASRIDWYVRSKKAYPEWIDLIAKHSPLRLIVVEEKLAKFRQGYRRWRFGKHIGRGSLELLGNLTGDIAFEHGKQCDPKRKLSQRAAILFEDNTAISKDGNDCFNIYMPVGRKQLINIGRTTIFFTALIAQDISSKLVKGNTDENFGSQSFWALQCSYQWSKVASAAWNKEQLHFYGDYAQALDKLEERSGASTEASMLYHHGSYKDLWNKWNESSIKLGTIDTDNDSRIELWRGEGVLVGYICVGGPKRSGINELVTKISQYTAIPQSAYPFNCLLVSAPGWGKSYLAKCLAKYFDMHFLEFSLAKMATSADLNDCFDTICSFQNTTQKNLLVFMDEVNAEIGGHSAMGLLLSPIWDGSFIRNGKTYRLSPTVWIFASTSHTKDLVAMTKGSDFVSRLNGPIIELDAIFPPDEQALWKEPFLKQLRKLKEKLITDPGLDVHEQSEYKTIIKNMPDHIKTEQVYLSISLLNKIWGPISRIREDVLQLLADILPINGSRSLEFFASRFRNIQHDEVTRENVPYIENFSELKRHVIFPKKWYDRSSLPKEGRSVYIVSLAPRSKPT